MSACVIEYTAKSSVKGGGRIRSTEQGFFITTLGQSGIVSIDDSQEFGSLDEVVEEFSVWGRLFYPTGVGFQFGYQADRCWWSALAEPARDIGEAILTRVPEIADLC
jgi:hypothetical protein